MYRISRHEDELIADVDRTEAIEPAIRSTRPARSDVECPVMSAG
jgi:hypothetical protein